MIVKFLWGASKTLNYLGFFSLNAGRKIGEFLFDLSGRLARRAVLRKN